MFYKNSKLSVGDNFRGEEGCREHVTQLTESLYISVLEEDFVLPLFNICDTKMIYAFADPLTSSWPIKPTGRDVCRQSPA